MSAMNKSFSAEKIKYPNRWPKGVSGNYRGRPRHNPQIKNLAQANTEIAIRTLSELLADPKSSGNLRFLCTVVLLRAASNVNLVQAFMRHTGMSITQYLLQPHIQAMQKETAPGGADMRLGNKLIQIRHAVLQANRL